MTTPQPHDPQCIFCRIAIGQIPCHKLYEDDHLLAFLDIAPLSPGHTILIPRAHYDTLDQLPDPLAAAAAQALTRLSRAVTTAVNVSAWNILQNNGEPAGQAVHHVHFHIIPRSPSDKLGFRWPAGQLSPDHAAQLVQAVRDQLA